MPSAQNQTNSFLYANGGIIRPPVFSQVSSCIRAQFSYIACAISAAAISPQKKQVAPPSFCTARIRRIKCENAIRNNDISDHRRDSCAPRAPFSPIVDFATGNHGGSVITASTAILLLCRHSITSIQSPRTTIPPSTSYAFNSAALATRHKSLSPRSLFLRGKCSYLYGHPYCAKTQMTNSRRKMKLNCTQIAHAFSTLVRQPFRADLNRP